MVEANSNLKLLLASIFHINTVFEHVNMLSIVIQLHFYFSTIYLGAIERIADLEFGGGKTQNNEGCHPHTFFGILLGLFKGRIPCEL